MQQQPNQVQPTLPLSQNSTSTSTAPPPGLTATTLDLPEQWRLHCHLHLRCSTYIHQTHTPTAIHTTPLLSPHHYFSAPTGIHNSAPRCCNTYTYNTRTHSISTRFLFSPVTFPRHHRVWALTGGGGCYMLPHPALHPFSNPSHINHNIPIKPQFNFIPQLIFVFWIILL